MNVAGITQQRHHRTATRGVEVHDVLGRVTDPRYARVDRVPVAPGRRSAGARDLLSTLLVLALLLPLVVLVWWLVDADLSRRSIVTLLALWSLAEVPLLLHVLRAWPADDATAEILSVGARAASVEARLRRDEERFHELRATVAGIGKTYRLLRNRRDRIPGTARTMLESLCDTELARLERLLVDDPPVVKEVLDIAAVVDPLVESFRYRGYQVARQCGGALAIGRADDIAEIVNTLLENAVRHAPHHPIEVRVQSTSSHVTVSVADQGPGVSADVEPHLFDRGVRAPDSPGQGIGLFVARGLAEGLGGDLRLDDDRSVQGATFTLSLPAADCDLRGMAATG